ncbi:hypothetical protein NEOLEDRAFT_1131150 [Neolentinus lepideus HHB14362 ss-1]|uniref:Uncharacterized protein n=1 Tax=Neolentinus lepideus HHB14362 ss-1 TaxID=1314782 RepID=A0A165TTC3_9AGAM|nr:hypothetical protein NEOLEDRAFT_1131150 [Neolentinus lepideus HHB14362 ss-1]
MAEFALANAVYATLVEGYACEIGACCNAMDNVSKNTSGMLTLSSCSTAVAVKLLSSMR